jgi:hypothetical protein
VIFAAEDFSRLDAFILARAEQRQAERGCGLGGFHYYPKVCSEKTFEARAIKCSGSEQIIPPALPPAIEPGAITQ